jgi:protein-tyrosine-phosphatase
VICLSTEHLRETKRTFPDAADRSFTLKGFLEILPSLPVCEDTVAWLSAAAEKRLVAESVPSPDVDDPFGERVTAYRRVASEIRDLIDLLAEGLERKRVGAPT